MGAARILIAEDEPGISSFLENGFRSAGFAPTVVEDGSSALTLARTGEFDLVVLDLGLPTREGLSVLEELRQLGIRLPVVILTARSELHDMVAGLDLGADDYVRKPFSVRELLARVRAQVRRDDWHSAASEEFSFGDVTVRLRQRLVLRGGQRVPLSAREFELLRYLIAHRGEVVSRAQLLRDVWGYHQLAVTRTVDNYVAKLRTQLEPEPHDPRYIVTVHGSGYQLLPWPGVAGPN